MKKSSIVSVIAIVLLMLIININSQENNLPDKDDKNNETIEEKQVFDVTIEQKSNNPDYLKVSKIIRDRNGLNISYKFDNSDFIGEEIQIELYISYKNGTELSRVSDIFNINRKGPIKREVKLELDKKYFGEYDLFLALYPEKEADKLKVMVFIEEIKEKRALFTGFTIFENESYKIGGYAVFIIAILIVIFIVVRKHDKDIDHTNSDIINEIKPDKKK